MYLSYTYAYPHKTAYRPLTPPVALRDVWANERKTGLFLYIHIPFCEMRCGFCNLFTTVNPSESLEHAFIDTLERQAEQVKTALGDATFARVAIGGGTPTYLLPRDLERVLAIAERGYGIDMSGVPVSIETSPATATDERLAVLKAHGIDRISIGVQSFQEQEVHGVGRAQKRAEVEATLTRIRSHGFPTLNIDLIYGLPYQTEASWRASLHAALDYAPEELYLYPLYQRPLTGLEKMHKSWDDHRLDLYRIGRDLLLERGYTQHSMRMFRAGHAPHMDGPVYCCQEDGMVGLGCGARSYTQRLHYSTEYAVQQRGVRAILENYVQQPDESFASAVYGFALDEDEQRRRYILKSVLHGEGLNLNGYTDYFGTSAWNDVPGLRDIVACGWAVVEDATLRLTTTGMEWSDTIGPSLYSPAVNDLTEAYDLQ